jgi:hypothetical protein
VRERRRLRDRGGGDRWTLCVLPTLPDGCRERGLGEEGDDGLLCARGAPEELSPARCLCTRARRLRGPGLPQGDLKARWRTLAARLVFGAGCDLCSAPTVQTTAWHLRCNAPRGGHDGSLELGRGSSCGGRRGRGRA